MHFVETIRDDDDVYGRSNPGQRLSLGWRRRPDFTTLREKGAFLCAACQIVRIQSQPTERVRPVTRQKTAREIGEDVNRVSNYAEPVAA